MNESPTSAAAVRAATWPGALEALLRETVAWLERVAPAQAAAVREPAERFFTRQWSVMVAGVCSVGKSSFVCALWGDAALLPTAARDCTQTNTRVCVPAPGEADRQVRLAYLPRAEAAAFTAQGFSYYRLAEMLAAVLGPHAPRLEELTPETRLRTAVAAVKTLCARRPELRVLHDYVADELAQVEQFLAFLEAPEYRPGATVPAAWDERRDLLMGRRRPDGRTLDVGKLWTLRHVELVRQSVGRWRQAAPVLIDTPWIPLFHEARRVDLIITQALRADILVILALPQAFQFEDWVPAVLRQRPELAQRTLVVFNQVDTLDPVALFGREGFAAAFEENARRLAPHHIDPRHLFAACARLPFLAAGPQDGGVAERLAKLRRVLDGIRKLVARRPESDFTRKLLAACEPEDAGLATLRSRLEDLAAAYVPAQRAREALEALEAVRPALTLPPAAAPAFAALRRRAEAIRAHLPR